MTSKYNIIKKKLDEIELLLKGVEISYIQLEDKEAVEIVVERYLDDIISVIHDLGKTHR